MDARDVLVLLWACALSGGCYFAGFWHGYCRAGSTFINIITVELTRARAPAAEDKPHARPE